MSPSLLRSEELVPMTLIRQSIGDCLENRIRETPDAVFIRYERESYSWKDMDRLSERVAEALSSEGIKKQSRVGIFGVNSPSWIATFFAVQKLGAVAVLINSYYKDIELGDCIEIADVEYVLYTGGDRSSEIEQVIGMMDKRVREKSIDIEKIFAEALEKKTDRAYKRETVDCDELCCIIFTSGTTGSCKGVLFNHFSLVNNAKDVVKKMHWTEADGMCLTVPLFHCFGLTISLIASIVGGMSISLLKRYRTVSVCETVQRDSCTILNGVPSMFLALIKNPDRKKYDLSALKSGIIAGSPIYENEYLDICKNLKNIKLQPSYGLTEASPCVSIADYEDTVEKKALSVGRVIDEVELNIVDISTKRRLGTREVGEILVRGYNVTQGYLMLKGESLDATDKDGWLSTGDLGYLDEKGYLYIAGRRKNLIIRGGENIYPNEIEHSIKEAAEGIEVFVFGIKTEVLQEEIVACIESKENPELEKKILYYLRKHLSHFKIPKYFLFKENFPRNSTGKINQKELKNWAKAQL